MFEQLSPTPPQERAILDGLLLEQGKRGRRGKKFVLALAAAVLMLLTCAAAVATGVDRRFLDYFGLEPEEEPLLSGCAVPLDVSVTDSGCTLEVTQVLSDRYTVMMVIDFTAPEGTVLGEDCYELGLNDMCFSIQGAAPGTRAPRWKLLEDGDPADHHISMLFTVDLGSDYSDLAGARIDCTPTVLYGYNGWGWGEVLKGNWPFSIRLPDRDTGRNVLEGETLWVNGEAFTLTSFYISPISVGYDLEGDFEAFAADPGIWDLENQDILLKTSGGESIAMSEIKEGDLNFETRRGRIIFRPDRIVDPEDVVSVTIYGQTFDLSA